MKAQYCSDFRRLNEDAQHFESIVPNVATGDVRAFSQTSGLVLFPPDRATCGSVYVDDGRQLFGDILIGRSVRLFQSPWGSAFLRRMMSKLEESDSEIHFATVGNKAALKNRMWSPEALAGLFGSDPTFVSAKQQVVTFRKATVETTTASILDWYLDHAMSMIVFDVLLRANPDIAHFERSNDLYLELLHDSAEKIIGGSRKRLTGEPGSIVEEGTPTEGLAGWMNVRSNVELEPELSRALRAQAYYVGGIAYKEPILKHIISECCDHRSDLRVIDFGGGYGLLAAELCLDPEIDISEAVCRDYSPANFVFAAKMYRELRSQLRGRFSFSVGKSEEFEFDGQYHVMCFVGSLLYTPSEQRRAALQRAWEHLVPGGILVVHENLKHESYKADYERMFTREEIDSLMGSLGVVRRFASTTIAEVSASDAQDKSVFRVVTKH